MKFPNAYSGVKKLFTAEILNIIATAALAGAVISGVILAASLLTDSSFTALAGGIGAAVLSIGAAVISIIALILALTGLKKAGIDEDEFDRGFVFALISLILAVVSALLTAIIGATIYDDLVACVSEVITVGVTLCVIKGISNLAVKLGNEKMAAQGRKIFILHTVLLCCSIVLRFIGVIVGKNSAVAVGAAVIAAISTVGSFAAYFIYLAFLGKAKKLLRQNQ